MDTPTLEKLAIVITFMALVVGLVCIAGIALSRVPGFGG